MQNLTYCYCLQVAYKEVIIFYSVVGWRKPLSAARWWMVALLEPCPPAPACGSWPSKRVRFLLVVLREGRRVCFERVSAWVTIQRPFWVREAGVPFLKNGCLFLGCFCSKCTLRDRGRACQGSARPGQPRGLCGRRFLLCSSWRHRLSNRVGQNVLPA